jgi:hypothetical protein
MLEKNILFLVINNRNTSYTMIMENTSPLVGLFWLNKGYTEILGPLGVNNFNHDDVLNKINIYPDGCHRDYVSVPSKLPRGRVELSEGLIKVFVGKKCPDTVLEMVIEMFNLEDFRNDVRLVKGYHWDRK